MFTGAEWTTIGTGVGVAATVLAFGKKLWGDIKKADPKLAQDITHAVPHAVVTGVEDAAKFVENLATSPFFAGEAAKGKLEVQHVLGALSNSKAAAVASDVLRTLGTDWSALTANEQKAALIMASNELSKAGIDVTDSDLTSLFHAADKLKAQLQKTATYQVVQELKAKDVPSTPVKKPNPAPQSEATGTAEKN